MQQLEERNMHILTYVPQVLSSCDLVLIVGEILSVTDLKSSYKDFDVALTGFRSFRAEPDGIGICCKNFPLFIKEHDCRFVNSASINARDTFPPQPFGGISPTSWPQKDEASIGIDAPNPKLIQIQLIKGDKNNVFAAEVAILTIQFIE